MLVPEAIQIINNDLNLMLNTDKLQEVPVTMPVTNNTNPKFSVVKKPFTHSELHYWQRFGITPEILIKYNVTSLPNLRPTARKAILIP